MSYAPTHSRKPTGRHRARRVRRVGLRAHAVVAVVGVGVGLSTGVATAFWTAGGTGDGSAGAGEAIPLTTVATTASSTSSLLYPNGPAADLTLTVQNPNTYDVGVTGVTANGAVTASGGIGTCATTGVSFATPTAGLPFTVPASGQVTVVLTGAAVMSGDSENGCQGATFAVPVALTGTGS